MRRLFDSDLWESNCHLFQICQSALNNSVKTVNLFVKN